MQRPQDAVSPKNVPGIHWDKDISARTTHRKSNTDYDDKVKTCIKMWTERNASGVCAAKKINPYKE